MSLRNLLLAGVLGLLGPGSVMSAAAEALAPPPTWVVDPATPGANLPLAGRSLFDQLFAVDRNGKAAIELPFPFPALLARLDAQLAQDPASPLPPAKRILIPLGRSLQRTAAAPDYFAYPRVVVAVDGEPASATTLFLKDRLYIGYQEKSAVLEVISYNEAAGRFEFQLVKDYRAGGQPQVVYAPRIVCFACHQNGAPIFSRALWDETNANPQVSALLAAGGRGFYGIPAERGVDIPYAIDNATERANRFALTQRLWREGCGDADLPARRCRAGLFSAALRHALAGGQVWLPDPDFEQAVSARLRATARHRWPGGLAIGNPDLPNRNPLQGMTVWPANDAARAVFSNVPARFEPLAPRPPQGLWQAEAPGAVSTLIAGLAEFVAAPDRVRLEAALARQANVVTERMTASCQIEASAPASRWSVRCAPRPGQSGPTLAGILSVVAGRPTAGHLSRLTLPGGTALSNLELLATGRSSAAGALFLPRVNGRPARSAEGNAIHRLEFRRSASNPAGGEVMLEVRQEFSAVERAMAALIESTKGETLFAPDTIPRQAMIAALFKQLGLPAQPSCCAAAQTLPAARLEVAALAPGARATVAVDGPLQAFFPYCAACHRTAETFPPNFLAGDSTQVAARLRQCAPRLYVRLAMADVPAELRDKTPMPPETVLPAFATDVKGWHASPVRAALLAQVDDWLHTETGQTPNLKQLLSGGYEALRPCLAAP